MPEIENPVAKTCDYLTFELKPVKDEKYPEQLVFTPQDMIGRYFESQYGSG